MVGRIEVIDRDTLVPVLLSTLALAEARNQTPLKEFLLSALAVAVQGSKEVVAQSHYDP
jgi:hypothetical protein